MSENLPPLPEGFKLDQDAALPPLPPGFSLETSSAQQKDPLPTSVEPQIPSEEKWTAAVGKPTEREARRTPSWIEENIDAAARGVPTRPVVTDQPFGPIVRNPLTHEEQARRDALVAAAGPEHTLSEMLLNDYVKIVTRHPGLQVWTDQNIHKAVKLVPETDKLTAYEYMISGGWGATRDLQGRDTGGLFWIPPVWASAPLSAVLGTMSGLLAAVGPSPESEPGSVGEHVRDLATQPVPGATTGARKFVAGSLSAATTVAGAALLPGPGATAGFFGLLGMGHLRDYMDPWVKAGDISPVRRDLFAVAGGLGVGLLQTFGFDALMKGLQPIAPQAIQAAKNLGGGVLLDLLRKPGIMDVAGSWARSTAHGLVGLTTSALTEEITHSLATGKKVDWENVLEAGQTALELGLTLGTFGAGKEYLSKLGRWHEAQHDANVIENTAKMFREGFAKAHPDDAREMLGKMMGGQKHVFVDASELAKVVPPYVADFLAGRDGALADALLVGSKIPVKVERLLVDHADIAEAVAKSATLHADGATVKEVGNKPPELREVLTVLEARKLYDAQPHEGTFIPVASDLSVEQKARLNATEAGPTVNARPVAEAVAQVNEALKKPRPMLDKRYRSGNYRKEWAATKADDVPLDQLEAVKRQHETAFRQAQREVERLTAQSASEQGKATAAAQKGVELGVEAAQVGRTAADVERANISSEQEWAATKRRKLRKLGPTIDKLSATEMVQDSSERLQKKAEDQSVKATGKEISAADKMKEAQRANNLKDNARALADALEKRRKEGLKIAQRVADMSEDDVRASMYKRGQQYGTAYDKIMEGIGAREPDGRTPFQTDLRVLKGWNPDITFDPAEVQQILDRKAQFGDLNIKDAKIIHDALRNLHSVARDASQFYIKNERIARDQLIGEMADALKARGLLPKQFTTGVANKESKLTGLFGVPLAAQGRFALWEPYGAPGAKINEEASRVHLEEQRLRAQWDRQVQAGFAKVQEAGIDPTKTVPMMDLDRSDAAPLGLRNYPKEIPLSSVWHMQLLAGSESGMDALAKGFRKTPAEIDAFLAKHINTREVLEYLQQIWDANEAIGEAASKARERREGIGFEKVDKRPIKRGELEFDGGYSGLRYEWDPERQTVTPANLADAYRQTVKDRADSPHYFTIERVPNTSGKIPMLSWGSMESNHRAVIHDATTSDFARDLHRTLEDPAFKSITAQYLGKEHLDQLKGWAQTEVVGSVPIVNEGIGIAEGLLRGATRLQGRGVFALNVPVAASQLSHLQIAKSFLGLSEEAMSVGVSRALNPSRWTETKAISEVVDHRAEHFFSGHKEMFDQITGDVTGPLMTRVDKAGRSLNYVIDRFLSNAILEAQLFHYQKEGATFSEALKKANAGLERVMPPLQIQDQSAFARNYRLLGTWVLVKNFPLAVGNMYKMLQWKTAAEIGAGRNPIIAKLDHGATTMGIIGGLAVGALLAGRGRNQEEQDSGAAGVAVWAGRTLTEEAFYHNPFGSLIAREVAPMLWNHALPNSAVGRALKLAPGHTEHGFSAGPAVQLLDGLSRDAQDLISDEKPNDEKAFALLHGLGTLTGLPPPAPLRGVKGAWRFLHNNLHNPAPNNLLGLIGTSVYGDRATTNIPTELGGLLQ